MIFDDLTLDPDLETWLLELKPYQREAIHALMENLDAEESAMKWLSSIGSDHLSKFGGTRDSKPFWMLFKKEFDKFVCDDEAYSEEKELLAKEGSITQALLISVMSGAIGASLGFAATLIAPAVCIMLWPVGKFGKNAYCMKINSADSAG